ncbi:hypothetical protein VTN96DRAFT_2831 [Rasamsonia emersonii]
MTRLHRQTFPSVYHLMSYAERDRFTDELEACVAQLRKIPNHTPYLFGNALGGPIIDHRIPDGTAGPFNAESDFNDHLTSHLGCSPADVLDGQTPRQDPRSYFTHSDFHAANLLVAEGGHLSGIVDWDCAGYKPEYWEFTKAMYTTRGDEVLEGIFRRAFGHAYEEELEMERKLWSWTPFGV